uniref:hypothetical protein n=1 Tax=Trichocoleus desertorum TaxID=1481672 RepID=UPI0025B42108|nr:hypothetical protein [Trichocoleus desertorum]
MGLDAWVYCNCFRDGKLREPPKVRWKVYVEETGGIACVTQQLEEQIAFDQWLALRACEHRNGMLLHHHLGNIALIALLRSELNCFPDDFPVLLRQVLYDGVHSGDYLAPGDIARLQLEIERLKAFRCSSSEAQNFVDEFCRQRKELVECSKMMNNPIVF